jgi:AraC family transcriptional regulator
VGTSRPLAELSVEAGFADQSHFTRLFRARTGLTPATYRRSHLK